MTDICCVDGCSNPGRIKSKKLCNKHYHKWVRHGDPLYQKYGKTCTADGCNRAYVSMGFCDMHYRRFRKHGDPNHIKKEYPEICSINGCNNSVEAKGYCGKHYTRFKKHGDPLIVKIKHTRHNKYYTAEYRTWNSMKQRCFNPNNKSYKDYAGRGITVCNRWKDSFLNFYEDMGSKPFLKAQIDRIDNDGNYEPGNCRWVTPKVNANNKRLIPKGQKLTPEQVREIRSLYPALKQTEIAIKYKVDSSIISDIVNYKIWKNVS